jgi:hypothetical protein
MKTPLRAFLPGLALALGHTASAQLAILANPSFDDVDLSEFRQVPGEWGRDDYDMHQPWEVAVPGWSHTTGSDTGQVFFRGMHLGSSQMFVLVENATPWMEDLPAAGPERGAYALAMQSGWDPWPGEPGDPPPAWVHAAVWQEVTLPPGLASVSFFAHGEVRATFNGIGLVQVPSRPGYIVADLRRFAGMSGELRFTNDYAADFAEGYPEVSWPEVILDDITFAFIPEPAAATPWGVLGLLMALGWRRSPAKHGRKHRRSADRAPVQGDAAG